MEYVEGLAVCELLASLSLHPAVMLMPWRILSWTRVVCQRMNRRLYHTMLVGWEDATVFHFTIVQLRNWTDLYEDVPGSISSPKTLPSIYCKYRQTLRVSWGLLPCLRHTRPCVWWSLNNGTPAVCWHFITRSQLAWITSCSALPEGWHLHWYHRETCSSLSLMFQIKFFYKNCCQHLAAELHSDWNNKCVIKLRKRQWSSGNFSNARSEGICMHFFPF